MVLLEVEQKFYWTGANFIWLQRNLGRPPFKSMANTKGETFQDTYYDSRQRLSSSGLWVRKREYPGSVSLGMPYGTVKWEAKQMKHGGSRLRSTFEETKDPNKILNMVHKIVPGYLGSCNNFGLDELCRFKTSRYSFLADNKFTVVLDNTDFGHQVGEVELLAEDADKAHRDIDAFLMKYAWFFDTTKPKGKLTAYFEEFGYPEEKSPEVFKCFTPPHCQYVLIR